MPTLQEWLTLSLKILAILAGIFAVAMLVFGFVSDGRSRTFYAVTRDWQPLLAAAAALIAAIFAYKAALAKVRSDEALERRKAAKKERADLLRLRLAIERIDRRVIWYLSVLDPPDNPAVDGNWRGSMIAFKGHEDIDEVWKQLESIPRGIADQLSELRIALFEYQDIVDEWGERDIDRRNEDAGSFVYIRGAKNFLRAIQAAGAQMTSVLDVAIARLEMAAG